MATPDEKLSIDARAGERLSATELIERPSFAEIVRVLSLEPYRGVLSLLQTIHGAQVLERLRAAYAAIE
ncbi:MAG: hypothetical protein NZ761_08630, partial [Dehalococcoidia bacterium]|nr:hypothetical protein [Dehalococcoidia bacterium]